MGLFSWIRRRHDEMDDETIEAADEISDETDEEREYMSGDIEGIAADNRAARSMNMDTMDDVDRFTGA